jgi:hypothetical protein
MLAVARIIATRCIISFTSLVVRNWHAVLAMPDIEITEECRALIAAEFQFDVPARRLSNRKWQVSIDAETWHELQRVQQQGESISECIIRVIILAHYKRGFL